MNKAYKSVYNESLGSYVAVPELANAKGKKISSARGLMQSKTSIFATAVLSTALSMLSSNVFSAVGTGGGTGYGTAISHNYNYYNCKNEAQANFFSSIAIGCGSVAELPNDTRTLFFTRDNPFNTEIRTDLEFYATAIGHNAKAYKGGTAIGDGAQAADKDNEGIAALGVAIGAQAMSRNVASVAIGPGALATGNTALAIGRQTAATADFAQAIGNVAAATAKGSLAIGHSATATGYRAIAIGAADIETASSTGEQAGVVYQPALRSYATGRDSIAFGGGANATKNNALAIGAFSKSEGEKSVAIGTGSVSTGSESVAIGNLSKTATGAVSIGAGSDGSGNNSVSIGRNSGATGANSVSIGENAKTIAGGVAVGKDSEAELANSIALGQSAKVTAVGGIALGQGSLAAIAGNVAGFEPNYADAADKAAISATKSTSGALSVGSVAVGNTPAIRRQISNVAAGTLDTDAVNVAQLKGVANTPLKFKGDNATVINRQLGQLLNILGGATAATTERNIVTTGNADGSIQLDLAKDLKDLSSAQFKNNTIPTVKIDGVVGDITGLTNKTLNAADFATKGRAATEEQLKLVSGTAGKGWNISANGATAANVAPGAQVDFSSSDSNIVVNRTDTNIKHGLAADLTIGNSITVGNTTINTTSVTTTNVNSTNVNTTNLTATGETKLGDNFIVNNDGKVTYNTYELATQNDGLKFAGDNKAVVINRKLNEQLNILGGAAAATTERNIVTTGNVDGSIQLDLAKDLKDLSSAQFKNNTIPTVKIDGVVGDITGLTNKTLNAADFATKGRAATEEQLKLVSGTAGKGWNISANGATAANVAPGAQVDFSSSDSNIVVNRTDTNIKHGLAADLTIGNSITVGNTTINTTSVTTTNVNSTNVNTTNLTATGETKLGDNFIVNNDGKVTYNTYELATQNDGLKFAGDNKAVVINRKLNEQLNILGGAAAATTERNIVTTGNVDGSIQLDLAKDLKDLSSAQFKNNTIPTVKIDGVVGDITGLTNKTLNAADFATKGRAATEEQLKLVSGTAGKGWNISANGATAANVAPGAQVDFSSSDSNIVVNRTDTNIKHGLAADLTIGNSITVGNTTINTTSVTTTNVNSTNVNTTNLTATGETKLGDNFIVNNDGKVTYNTYELATQNDGLKFAGDNKAVVINRKLNEQLNILGGAAAATTERNIVTTGNVDGSIQLDLAKDLQGLNSAIFTAGGNTTTLNSSGLSIANGPSITNVGIDAGNKVITNVAPGVNGTDGVNVSQLKEIEAIANKGWNVSANGATAAKVVPGATVDFSNSDGNIVVSREDTQLKHNLAADLTIDNSVTVGDTIINKTSVTTTNLNTTNLSVSGETQLGDNFWVTKEGDVHYNGPITGDTHIVNKKYVDNSIGEVTTIASKGWNISVNGATAAKVAPAATVDLGNNDGNIVVSRVGTEVKHDLSSNLKIGESITIGENTSNQTIIKQGGISSNTVNVGGGTFNVKPGSVSIKEGTTIDMGGNRVTNVAEGVAGTDAVNVNQLKAAISNNTNFHSELNRVDRDARAGTASAAAMANLPQAYLPGKSMFAIATAGHRGEQGYAAGLSTISEGGKWVLKGSVSGNSRGDVTYGAGVGYQW
ncbi:MAG: YadA-like family protein [Pelistega sp.]|nr:YadA-like family protein [Pelistega sp.]